MAMVFVLRDAREADLPSINAIYNHYVFHSTCTYQTEPATMGEREGWWQVRRGQGGRRYPVLVAVEVEEGEEKRVVGWGSLGPFHAREAYRFTAENSVYIDPGYQRRGLGKRLLAELLTRAEGQGIRSVIAVISADQEGSVGLHKSMGFVEAGLLKGVGFKFERWLDVVYLQWEAGAKEKPGA